MPPKAPRGSPGSPWLPRLPVAPQAPRVLGLYFIIIFARPDDALEVGTSVPTSTKELPIPLGFEWKNIKWEMEGGLQGTRNKTKHLKHVGPR